MLTFDKSGKRKTFKRVESLSKDQREVRIIESLNTCRKIGRLLKDKFPNEIMKLTENSIIMHDRKDRRCTNRTLNRYYAYYQNRGQRVCLLERVLVNRKMARTCPEPGCLTSAEHRPRLEGNFAFGDCIAHELSHHNTTGHAKAWKLKYIRMIQEVALLFISGKFYKSVTTEGGESV